MPLVKVGATSVVVFMLVLASCTGDDDADPATTPAASASTPVTTRPPTTSPPTTVAPPTTTLPPVVTAPPTTSVEQLKAEIAAAFVELYQRREDLARAPSLEGLADRVAAISVPGSPSYAGLEAFVQDLVRSGERTAPNDPDYSDVTVESVTIIGETVEGRAEVIACDVTNQVRLGPDGRLIEGSDTLYAARISVPLLRTPDGWRETDEVAGIAIQTGVPSCPAP